MDKLKGIPDAYPEVDAANCARVATAWPRPGGKPSVGAFARTMIVNRRRRAGGGSAATSRERGRPPCARTALVLGRNRRVPEVKSRFPDSSLAGRANRCEQNADGQGDQHRTRKAARMVKSRPPAPAGRSRHPTADKGHDSAPARRRGRARRNSDGARWQVWTSNFCRTGSPRLLRRRRCCRPDRMGTALKRTGWSRQGIVSYWGEPINYSAAASRPSTTVPAPAHSVRNPPFALLGHLELERYRGRYR